MVLKMRLINADKLKKSGLRVEYGYDNNGVLLIPYRDVLSSIDAAPAIDAVPVVRCKECALARNPDNSTMIGRIVTCCLYSSRPVMSCNDFCSYGKRKKEGEP